MLEYPPSPCSGRFGKAGFRTLFQRAAYAVFIINLALPGALVAAPVITEADGVATYEMDQSFVRLDTVNGQLLAIGYREEAGADWREQPVRMHGLRLQVSGNERVTTDFPADIRHTVLDGHLIVKVSHRQDGLYWNLWYHLEDGQRVVESARFVYGEDLSLRAQGVGVAFEVPQATVATETLEYEELGGTHTGGYADFTEAGGNLRVYVSNMEDQEWRTDGDTAVLWCRYGENRTWGTRIDYRRLALVPYETGESLEEWDRYSRLFVFDHDLSNVELAASWILRYRNRTGAVRDWFNASDYPNSFIPATGSSYVTKSGFWRDDWTTGALLRGVRKSWDVTRDPFYFMRFMDLLDYQVDRMGQKIKNQWGPDNPWQENYPMGRIEAAMDAWDLAGWEDYRDIAVNSVDWFFTTETFVPGGGHRTDHNVDYSDMAYCFEGLYRADLWNNDRWKQKIDDYYASVESTTWNDTSGLYGHMLGGGLNDHWARGHGWWFQTFSNIMDYYGGENADEIRENFERAADNLIRYQDGLWHKQITNPTTFLDASGGAMIAAGMAESFLRGELGVEALESAMEAIRTLTVDHLESDGTLTGTDRHNAPSPDPFPYTQEAYIDFARIVGIAEVAVLSERNTLPVAFSEGVMIADLDGGTATDVNGESVTVDGDLILDAYGPDKRSLRLLGSGTRNLELNGFEPDRLFTVTDYAITANTTEARAVTADSGGALELALDLSGEHWLTLHPRAAGTVWADRVISPEGFMQFDGLGWVYDAEWPYVWIAAFGWTYAAAGESEPLWLYDYGSGGWRFTSSQWNGWYYDDTGDQWVQAAGN